MRLIACKPRTLGKKASIPERRRVLPYCVARNCVTALYERASLAVLSPRIVVDRRHIGRMSRGHQHDIPTPRHTTYHSHGIIVFGDKSWSGVETRSRHYYCSSTAPLRLGRRSMAGTVCQDWNIDMLGGAGRVPSLVVLDPLAGAEETRPVVGSMRFIARWFDDYCPPVGLRLGHELLDGNEVVSLGAVSPGQLQHGV